MSRWAVALVFVFACSTSTRIEYSAIYASVHPFAVVDSALVAAEEKGYAIADVQKANHSLGFLARPHEIDKTGAIQVGLRVHLFFERQSVDGSDVREKWNVLVVPIAFSNGIKVSSDRLPESAEAEARALADAMRSKARHWEAPSL
jgi:hypothetical protein